MIPHHATIRRRDPSPGRRRPNLNRAQSHALNHVLSRIQKVPESRINLEVKGWRRTLSGVSNVEWSVKERWCLRRIDLQPRKLPRLIINRLVRFANLCSAHTLIKTCRIRIRRDLYITDFECGSTFHRVDRKSTRLNSSHGYISY